MEARLNPLARIFYWLNIGLFIVIVFEIIFFVLPRFQSGDHRGSSAVEAVVDMQPLSRLAALNTYQEAIDRSLFSWNRKPKSGVKTELSSEGLAEKWQLTGLVNTGISTYAIFREVDGSRQLKLEEGMYLDKWSVESVTRGQITLTKGEESEVLLLRESTTEKEEGSAEVPAEGK
jgi:hypothetical protein